MKQHIYWAGLITFAFVWVIAWTGNPYYAASSVQGENTHTVRAGETLWRIAHEHELTVQEIMEANDIADSIIEIGQTLILPQPDLEKRYVVSKGDTLWKIARQYNIDVRQLQITNQLHSDNLQIGQLLRIDENDERHGQTVQLANHVQRAENEQSRTSQSARIPYSQSDYEWLVRIIESESRGEPYEGKVAVGSVVINRVLSDNFPDSIEEVIFQRTGKTYQFTPVANGRIHTLTPSEKTHLAAQEALYGADPTNGALFFYNPTIATDQWIRTRSIIYEVGGHVFAY